MRIRIVAAMGVIALVAAACSGGGAGTGLAGRVGGPVRGPVGGPVGGPVRGCREFPRSGHGGRIQGHDRHGHRPVRR